ncbi:MAG TPA: acyl-CoA thioesterase [Vicinamibacterales bacterium]|jgi:acyl-CoA thioesterase YciA|nr:acyl-CoA thioesterase [Vicinamibacterales bacterium]
MPDRIPAIRVLLLPKDTNAYGTIFGGVILSNIDLASAVEARKLAPHRYVTKAMHEVEFHEPVFVGDLVDFYTETVRVGRTSVTVRVSVEAERWGSVAESGPIRRGERVKVTEAEVVLVAVNELGRPIPIRPEIPTA